MDKQSNHSNPDSFHYQPYPMAFLPQRGSIQQPQFPDNQSNSYHQPQQAYQPFPFYYYQPGGPYYQGQTGQQSTQQHYGYPGFPQQNPNPYYQNFYPYQYQQHQRNEPKGSESDPSGSNQGNAKTKNSSSDQTNSNSDQKDSNTGANGSKSSNNNNIPSNSESESDRTFKTTPEFEDELKRLAEELSFDWKRITKSIYKILKRRVKPGLLKHKFTDYSFNESNIAPRAKFNRNDDRVIVNHVNQHGYEWSRISRILVYKTPLMIKNRYYYLKKKGLIPEIEQEIQKGVTSKDDVQDELEEKVEVPSALSKPEIEQSDNNNIQGQNQQQKQQQQQQQQQMKKEDVVPLEENNGIQSEKPLVQRQQEFAQQQMLFLQHHAQMMEKFKQKQQQEGQNNLNKPENEKGVMQEMPPEKKEQ